ncbi:MAG: hypothetical protein M0009_14255 [Deltaproteobacteria bacterium]|nr:hypothetical protein [Deltaproteobacteria bacterium]
MKKSLIMFWMLAVFMTVTFMIAGHAQAADRYVINRDQTVYDTQTNLTWAARVR